MKSSVTTAPPPVLPRPSGPSSNTCLYVGDIHPAVSEERLRHAFTDKHRAVSVKLCHSRSPHVFLNHAFVSFESPQDACKALEELNHFVMNEIPIRVMFHNRIGIYEHCYANVCVKNLDLGFSSKMLQTVFSDYGAVISCKVAFDYYGVSKGYGFVQFQHEFEAQNAILGLNGKYIGDRRLRVELFIPRRFRSIGSTSLAVDNSASLHVGNLDSTVTEEQVNDLFSKIGNLKSIKIYRNRTSEYFPGYAYVNFEDPQDAHRGLEKNLTPLNGRPIRVTLQNKDLVHHRKNGYANVFVKNLPPAMDEEKLFKIFKPFGNILSSKVVIDSKGKKRRGYVQFENENQSQKAISECNGKMYDGNEIQASQFTPLVKREPKFTNIYVKKFPSSWMEEELRDLFSICGKITSAKVVKDENGKSKGFGFINFECTSEAQHAIDKFNGILYDGKALYVGRAQKKAERVKEVKKIYEQKKCEKFVVRGQNLYVKHLPYSYNDESLRQLFSEFGNITSAKVMVNLKGLTLGFGFVAFSELVEAQNALKMMSGKKIEGKPLYVAIAEPKCERSARMKEIFAQRVDAPQPPVLRSPSHVYTGTPCMTGNFVMPCNNFTQGQQVYQTPQPFAPGLSWGCCPTPQLYAPVYTM